MNPRLALTFFKPWLYRVKLLVRTPEWDSWTGVLDRGIYSHSTSAPSYSDQARVLMWLGQCQWLGYRSTGFRIQACNKWPNLCLLIPSAASPREALRGVQVLTTEIAKILFGMVDKMSGRGSVLCRTYWTPVRHFPTWWLRGKGPSKLILNKASYKIFAAFLVL